VSSYSGRRHAAGRNQAQSAWERTFKQVLSNSIGVVALAKLMDFIFYGRQLNIFGVMGFVLMQVGAMMQKGQSSVNRCLIFF